MALITMIVLSTCVHLLVMVGKRNAGIRVTPRTDGTTSVKIGFPVVLWSITAMVALGSM